MRKTLEKTDILIPCNTFNSKSKKIINIIDILAATPLEAFRGGGGYQPTTFNFSFKEKFKLFGGRR